MLMTNEKCIDILQERWRYTKTYKYTDEEIKEAQDKAIKALEQTSWIPVSERLPEDEQKALITARSGSLIYVGTSIFHHSSAFWEHYVIAWMPLPEPYKSESEE